MERALLEQAIYNNAVWCDTVCRAHGRPGTFYEEIWINRNPTPRSYPNAVTLTQQTDQKARIQELIGAGLAGDWGIKDSFCSLALASLGFRVLFEAEWICRTASLPRPEGDVAGMLWVRVDAPADLAAWESAWSGQSPGDSHADSDQVFLASLLAEHDVAILAGCRGEHIIAGGIANRTADVVGLSNVFVPHSDGERLLAGCLAAAIDVFPSLPIVGYEGGRPLAAMRALGFDILGPLRVWVKQGPTTAARPPRRSMS